MQFSGYLIGKPGHHRSLPMRAFISVNFSGARYLFIKNFISIAYVLAHPLQGINKWTLEFRKREGGEKGDGRKWDLPGKLNFPIFERGFSSELSCCSRKSPQTLSFFFKDDFLFLFSVSSVHCREQRGQLRRGGGGTFRSIRSKWPARSFPFSRMNFRRVDLRSRKRAWKFQVLKSKFLETTTGLERLLRGFHS